MMALRALLLVGLARRVTPQGKEEDPNILGRIELATRTRARSAISGCLVYGWARRNRAVWRPLWPSRGVLRAAPAVTGGPVGTARRCGPAAASYEPVPANLVGSPQHLVSGNVAWGPPWC